MWKLAREEVIHGMISEERSVGYSVMHSHH